MSSRTQTQNAMTMNTLISKNRDAIVKYVLKQHRKNDLNIHFEVEADTNGYTTSGNIKTDGLYFKQVLKKLGTDEYVNIKINPILPVRLCFWNSHEIIKVLNKKKSNRFVISLGFNPTACPCSQFITLEPHVAVYDTETKSYHDFTRDFGGEAEKIFIPIWTDMENKMTRQILSMWGFNHRWFVNKMGEHQCRNYTRSGRRQRGDGKSTGKYIWRVRCFNPIPSIHKPLEEFNRDEWIMLSMLTKANITYIDGNF